MGYRCKSGIKRIVTLNYGYSQQKKYTFEKERKSPRKASFFYLRLFKIIFIFCLNATLELIFI